ncbi:enoyl-CoA hydratase [Alicyclobacillus dauci]|uniref:Enoyl-CoA hydratase n=1 Tax=Alicyclobacillus dauci TaxID=1475485 RepID=A0ABY6Z752_9BACL|nr:enoyl-CoA hydratase [Alicyclobacillus dauci]WAH38719.1 enoyl-CoA hydratase [Alicyclobacillus dauci]
MNDLVLRHDHDGGIVVLGLNREDAANALSTPLLEDLLTVIAELHHAPNVRVVILTGRGSKAFCAGADLKERRGMDDGQVRRAVARIRRAVEAVAQLPMPVIAAVNGVAFGGGTELALAADIRILADTAKMGLTETSLAIIPGAGGTQRLPRVVGVAKAKELIYTARRIDAETALQLGLANRVVPATEVLETAMEMAREIARNGPIAVRQAKFAIDAGMSVDLQSGLSIEKQAYEMVIPTEDRLEGLNAFAEKRKPQYRGK